MTLEQLETEIRRIRVVAAQHFMMLSERLDKFEKQSPGARLELQEELIGSLLRHASDLEKRVHHLETRQTPKHSLANQAADMGRYE
jgi:hypothetical protein